MNKLLEIYKFQKPIKFKLVPQTNIYKNSLKKIRKKLKIKREEFQQTQVK